MEKMFNFKNAALLIEGIKDIYNAKTASALAIYRLQDILCYVQTSGLDPNSILSTKNIPVVKNLTELPNLTNKKVDMLILCLMLPDGKIPISWELTINYALEHGIDIINPFHFNLADFSFKEKFGGLNNKSTESLTIFNNSSSKIFNLRIPESENKLFSFKILDHKPKRIATVGTDCNVGKMLSTIELNKYALSQNYKSTWVATGQIGIMLKGNGVCVDRIISDFLPGVVEDLILKESQDLDYIFIEGQGSLFQPLYAPVTLGLLHGSAPNSMILCHSATRTKLRYTNIEFRDFKEIIDYYEYTASLVLKSKVIGLSLNTHGMKLEESKDLIKYYEDYLQMPVTDPVKFGVKNLFDVTHK